jgi:hypothetical protein
MDQLKLFQGKINIMFVLTTLTKQGKMFGFALL